MQVHLQAGRGPVVEQFHRLHAQAKRRQFWSRLFGQPSMLHCLHEDIADRRSLPRPKEGIQLIPLAQIQGSEGRCGDFDADFRPLQWHNEERWINIALAYNRDAGLPPVQLLKVGERYYVRDGHHRISVAHSIGMKEIEAEVTVLDEAEE
ncbi:MAG TPA: hypothetical protein PKE45_11405 [Caldilineaceae bacterium]|nr:hypothetical protein [Caldilineaceae bacterium]